MPGLSMEGVAIRCGFGGDGGTGDLHSSGETAILTTAGTGDSTMLRTPIRRSALAFLFAAGPLAAQAPRGRPLAIEDYYRVKTVGAVELSSDARWVAFTLTTRVNDTNGSASEVWLVSADGSAVARRVSPDGANASAPSWLDDGRLRYSVGGLPVSADPLVPDSVDSASFGIGPGSGRGGRRGGRGGARGGRGGGANGPIPSPDGKWVALVRDTPPPKVEKV